MVGWLGRWGRRYVAPAALLAGGLVLVRAGVQVPGLPLMVPGFEAYSLSVSSRGDVLAAGMTSLWAAPPHGAARRIALGVLPGCCSAAVGASGEVFVRDFWNSRVARLTPAGRLVPFAGSGVKLTPPVAPALLASPKPILVPWAIASGPDGSLAVAEIGSRPCPGGSVESSAAYGLRVRRWDAHGGVTTLIAAHTSMGLGGPTGVEQVALAPDGSVYTLNFDQVWRLHPDGRRTLIGRSSGIKPRFSAALEGAAVDGAGNLYLGCGSRVYRIEPAGRMSAVAGNGSPGPSRDGIPALRAGLSPKALACDGRGNLYILDGPDRIRRVDRKGMIWTVVCRGRLPLWR